jgi:hypothetical protein
MKERPILFSGPMVKAILEGRKMQTRRIVKPQPTTSKPESALEHGDIIIDNVMGQNEETNLFKLKESKGHGMKRAGMLNAYPYYCPYGKIGDRLWVREFHARIPGMQGLHQVHYMVDGPIPSISERHDAGLLRTYPSIHMPRWASRITLEITDIRVQRVQEISEADAKAEGLPPSCPQWSLINDFKYLWNSLHGPDAWERNDWVWALTFKKLEGL